MSYNRSSNYFPIKILILDLYPSYDELNPDGEELLLIFEGINIFFDLKDLLTSKNKIEINNNNNQSRLIVSLIKSNNIIASGYLNLKYGEQWIKMNSENKKKSTMNLALSLIDCIKIKIFCEMKNMNKTCLNNNKGNINISSLNATNINNNINLTTRSIKRKSKQKINQLNLKISKKNTNNNIMVKGSPEKKINLDIYNIKRSPKTYFCDYNIKYATNTNNFTNDNMLKNSNPNYNSINTHNSLKSNNYSNPKLRKNNIKKLDLYSSNKTRNNKLNRKSPTRSKYTSLRISNNYTMAKMNTSTFNLNNHNKNKKQKIFPDIEIKELHNSKIIGKSPKLYHKNKLNDDIYHNSRNSGKRKYKYDKKNVNNFHLEKNFACRDNLIHDDMNKAKKNNINEINNNFSNNILNINYENNNNIINMNIVNNINDNQSKTLDSNIYSNIVPAFGNHFNKKDLKSKGKLLYQTKEDQLYVNQSYNYLINNNLNNNKKSEFEKSPNVLECEDKNVNKTKEYNKISAKMGLGITKGVYTNKRLNVRKNKTQIIKKDKNININPDTNLLIQKTEANIEDDNNKENNEYIINSNIIDKEENNKINKTYEIGTNNNKDFEDINEDYNNFGRLKEDFLLLYNNDYMNNIQEDLLKLEIELFVEKMAELIQCYHDEYNQKKMENDIIKNKLNINCKKYKKIQKLIKQFDICKIDNEINNIKKNINCKGNNLSINKDEIGIFKNIFSYENNNRDKNMLKNIFNKIINNKNNKNIKSLLDKDKYEILLNTSINKNIKNLDSNNTYKKKIIDIAYVPKE